MSNYSKSLSKFISTATSIFDDLLIDKEPSSLYNPINSFFLNKGKYTRALLSLLVYNFFNSRISDISHLVLAIESLHNFTLIHDDVMDNAVLRRGAPTINAKWSNNQAILSGDVLLIHAYSHLLKSNINTGILNYFNQTALEICEGQQLDFDLQNQKSISLDQYYHMVYLKTGVLIKFALTAPCLLSENSETQLHHLNIIGDHLGTLFQIQDDYLDLYGEAKHVGKLIGGDIYESKKTFLYAMALNLSDSKQKSVLVETYHQEDKSKLQSVLSIYEQLHVKNAVKNKIQELGSLILKEIEALNVSDDKKVLFSEFINVILNRKK